MVWVIFWKSEPLKYQPLSKILVEHTFKVSSYVCVHPSTGWRHCKNEDPSSAVLKLLPPSPQIDNTDFQPRAPVLWYIWKRSYYMENKCWYSVCTSILPCTTASISWYWGRNNTKFSLYDHTSVTNITIQYLLLYKNKHLGGKNAFMKSLLQYVQKKCYRCVLVRVQPCPHVALCLSVCRLFCFLIFWHGEPKMLSHVRFWGISETVTQFSLTLSHKTYWAHMVTVVPSSLHSALLENLSFGTTTKYVHNDTEALLSPRYWEYHNIHMI